jgi:dTDP-4-dehydrorhamnose 3,5-epimerase
MKFNTTDVENCFIVMMDRYHDNRGFFQELYEQDKYSEILSENWQQTNWSVSNKNVLRGIHVANYAKLVTCITGKIWDVVVDLRPNSTTYTKYVGVELTPDEPKQIYVPSGCGHGFVSLEDNSSVVYMQTGRFAEQGEITIMYNEPLLNIPWPGENHTISKRDEQGQFLT